jgi:hypothetical protein
LERARAVVAIRFGFEPKGYSVIPVSSVVKRFYSEEKKTAVAIPIKLTADG